MLNAFGITSNIMSLTGIALAIGVIVDNGIIMSENSYRQLAEWTKQAARQMNMREIFWTRRCNCDEALVASHSCTLGNTIERLLC